MPLSIVTKFYEVPIVTVWLREQTHLMMPPAAVPVPICLVIQTSALKAVDWLSVRLNLRFLYQKCQPEESV